MSLRGEFAISTFTGIVCLIGTCAIRLIGSVVSMGTWTLTVWPVSGIAIGTMAVVFIGMKAKTALASGGISGVVALLMAWLINQDIDSGRIGGILLTILLTLVFSWRATKTLFKIFGLLQASTPSEELNAKGIAFLIISLILPIHI